MSFGHKFGRGCGVVGALVVEGTVRTALAAGQFGSDALEGAEQGYTEKSATLLASRNAKIAAAKAAREALIAAHQAAMTPAVEAVVEAPAPVVTPKRAKAAA